jgi:hypothetical protein
MTSDMPTTPSGGLGRRSGLHHVVQRHDGGGGEIRVTDRPARLVEDLAQRHGDQLQFGRQALELGRRQGGKQVVLCRALQR